MVCNMVLMEQLIMTTSFANSISFNVCLEKSDVKLLIRNYFETNVYIFFVLAIVQLYIVMYFLVTQRNEFRCGFLTYLATNIMVFHPIIIYQTIVLSKKLLFALFTVRQWVGVFVILKLQCDFTTIQQNAYSMRLSKKPI